MPRFENPSVAGPEFRDKRKRGRPKRERGRSKRERGRYISEAAPRFGNVCTNPALFRRSLPILRKKLSNSRKKPSDFRNKPSGLRRSHAANAFRKGIPNCGINFKDAYRRHTSIWFVITFFACVYWKHKVQNASKELSMMQDLLVVGAQLSSHCTLGQLEIKK